MKKTSVFIIMGILLVSLASAEMTLNIGVASDEVDVNIDGLNFGDTVNDIWSQDDRWSAGMDDMHIYRLLDGAADLITGNYQRNSVISYRDEEWLVAGSLNRAFATKQEANYLYELVNQLSIRIEALEKTLEEVAGDEYCRQKIEVTLSHGLHAVKCEDTQYYNAQVNGLASTGLATLGVKSNGVEEEELIEEEEIIEESVDEGLEEDLELQEEGIIEEPVQEEEAEEQVIEEENLEEPAQEEPLEADLSASEESSFFDVIKKEIVELFT